MKKVIGIMVALVFVNTTSFTQDKNLSGEDSRLNVFVDCGSCNVAYFKQHFKLINFITKPGSADVHVLHSSMGQADDNIVSSMIFIGNGRFSLLGDTLDYSIPAESSAEEIRTLELEKLKLGLVPFLLKTKDALLLSVSVKESNLNSEETFDPWKRWSFGISGLGSFTNQLNTKMSNLYLDFNASKVTEDFKAEFSYELTYSESEIKYEGIDTAFLRKYYYQTHSSRNLIVKSLGEHFGIGGAVIIHNDRPHNVDLRFLMGPAIEYNIYPYSKALQKQFRFVYSILYEHSDYIDTTIYNKLQDQYWKQGLNVLARFQEPWGHFDAGVYGTSYLHNLERFSLGANLSTHIRLDNISKGLSVNFSAGLAMYRDRINEAKYGVDFEEVLSQQKAMETSYSYNLSFGITYRFGSSQYPDLNPRFGY